MHFTPTVPFYFTVELLNDPFLEVVYIPLPTALHEEWVIKAAQAKKHILLEKPCGVSLESLSRMLAVCEEHHVRLMDGVMFMHYKRLDKLQRVLEDPLTGAVIKCVIDSSKVMLSAPYAFRM